MIPTRTRIPVATSNALIVLFPRRHAAGGPSVVSVRVNVGMKAALMAPSAKRSRSRLGTREATINASIVFPAPKRAARICSRTRPRMRLVMVAAPADAAERASGGASGEVGSGAKPAPHGFVHRAPVGMLAGEPGHHCFHHLPHVLHRGRSGLGNRGGH